MEHESDVYTSCDWCSWYSHRRIGTRTGGLGNNGTSGNYPKYYIIENGQNIEKSPGDLRRHAVIQTSVKDHHLTLMWKRWCENNYNKCCYLSLIGIILRWGFLIWELIFFIYCGVFVLILAVFFLCCFFFHYVSAGRGKSPEEGQRWNLTET